MFEKFKEKEIWRGVGIILISGLVLTSWWIGFFEIIFYVLGLYVAVYVISYIFKTTAVISFLLTIGGIILYVGSVVIGLYLLWNILTVMFTSSFFLGALFLLLLGVFGSFLPMTIGMTLGYPLIFMSEDIERRFHSVSLSQSEDYKIIDSEDKEEEITDNTS